MITIAKKFGESLDRDEFEATKECLSPDCKYTIGEDVLIGPEAICNSYEQNMIEGRNKLDRLEWGKCRIEQVTDSKFLVHFTDYLNHKGFDHIHRCTQKLYIKEEKISRIEQLENIEEQNSLNEFYQKVGLK